MAGFDYECDGQMSIEDWLATKEQEELHQTKSCNACIFSIDEDCPIAAEDCKMEYLLKEADGWKKIINYPNGRVGGKWPTNPEWQDVLVLAKYKGELYFYEVRAKDKTFWGKNKVRWDMILAWKYI